MTRKALLTGATGGLGSQIAKLLAENGWDLVFLNRNPEQTEQLLTIFHNEYPGQSFDGFLVDLMDIDGVKSVTQEISSKHSSINALYNVAGLLTDKRIVSPQEIEGHFALNAVAPYVLIRSLMTQLGTAATSQEPAYVANFSSEVVNGMQTLAVERLVDPETIGGLKDAYAKTKAALNVMACFLKDKLLAENIYIYSVDPGPTRTQMTSSNPGMPWFVRLLVPFLFGDPAQQARKVVAGIDAELKHRNSGSFISNGKIRPNPPVARNTQIQNQLRELLDELIQ